MPQGMHLSILMPAEQATLFKLNGAASDDDAEAHDESIGIVEPPHSPVSAGVIVDVCEDSARLPAA